MSNTKKILIILLSIIILAAGVRVLIVVCNTESYWFDEVVSLEIAKKGIQESWQYLRGENNPPAHYWFLHYWVKMFGEGEKAVRMSSVLFGVLNILMMYVWVKSITKKKEAGLAAAFLMAFSSFQIYLSMDARMYSMLAFFTILSCYFFWSIIQGQGNRYHKIFYLLFTVAALYTHLTAAFVLLAQNLFCFFYRRDINWRKWLVGQLLILLLFSPWLYFFVSGSLTHLNGEAWYFDTGDSGFYLFEMPKFFLILGQKIVIIELAVMTAFAILILANFVRKGVFYAREKKWEIFFGWDKEVVFVLILFVIPLLFGFALQLWVAKYFLASALGFYALAAMGFGKLFQKGSYQIIVGSIVLILFLPFIIDISFSQGGHQWDKVAAFLKDNERPGDKIFLPAFVYELPLRYYYKGQTEIISMAPTDLEKDVLMRAVKYNWAPLETTKNIPEVGDLVNDAERILVVYPVVPAPIHRAEKVLDWFVFNRWCLEARQQFWGFEQPAVLIFVNPKLPEIGECERKNAVEWE